MALVEWAKGANWATLVRNDEIRTRLEQIQQIASKSAGTAGGAGGSSTPAAAAGGLTSSARQPAEDVDLSNARRVKLVVVGDGAVGKTSLLIVQATGKFPTDYVPTVFENYTAQMERKGKPILLHLWDTAGQEDYDRLRPLSYPGADIVLLCFSTINKSSFDAVRDKWAPEVQHYIADVPHVLVGTKIDLREAGEKDPVSGKHQPISTEMGKGMMREIGAVRYHEVCAKTCEGMSDLFESAIDIVLSSRGDASDGADGVSAGGESSGVAEVVAVQKKKKKSGGGCMLLQKKE